MGNGNQIRILVFEGSPSGTGLSRDGTAEEAVPNSFEHCRWKAIFLAARSQIYLTLEATFLIVKIVLLQENGLAIAISN